MKRVSIGFIGVGDILSSHLDGLKANPEYELVSVCRRTKEKLEGTAHELSCKGFTDYHDLLESKPDVVLVSLPHGLHCSVAIDAFKAGCHVLVEKPMAVNVEECRSMLEAAKQYNRHLIVTESASFIPGAVLTGKKFRNGELGRFFTGSIINERFYFTAERPEWFLDPAMSGGGMFSNVGLHRLAVARACLPGLTPVSVSASVSYMPEYKIEACTSALVKYEGGGAMLYEEVGYFPKPDWLNTGTHFIFERGIVMWDNKVWRMITRDGKQIEEELNVLEFPYAPVYKNSLHAIRNEAYGPTAYGYALDVAIAKGAYASSQENREICFKTFPLTLSPDL